MDNDTCNWCDLRIFKGIISDKGQYGETIKFCSKTCQEAYHAMSRVLQKGEKDNATIKSS